MHTPKGEVQFHKDKQGLPYINLEESNMAAAMMLLQQEMLEQKDMSLLH